MAKLYEVQLVCGHTATVTAEPSTGTCLSVECSDCDQVKAVSRWTGTVIETEPVVLNHVEPVKVEEDSD